MAVLGTVLRQVLATRKPHPDALRIVRLAILLGWSLGLFAILGRLIATHEAHDPNSASTKSAAPILITGIVVDDRDTTIAGATVTIGNLRDTTDFDGRFRIELPSARDSTGPSLVTFAPGYRGVQLTVTPPVSALLIRLSRDSQ